MYKLTYLLLPALVFIAATTNAKPEVRLPKEQARSLSFIENKGQITDQHNKGRKDIDFKLSVDGMSIFVGDGQLHYQWYKTTGAELQKSDRFNPKNPDPDGPSEHPTTEIYRMDVTLMGANINAPLQATEEQAYYERYFSGKFGNDGALAHTYNRVTYTNVYPNIDWILYTKDGQLKYDFVVRPGGNPANIKLKYSGGSVALNKDGSVTASTPFGSITDNTPYSYVAETGAQVTSEYLVHDGMVQFNIAASTHILVIDPVINWATYYGGPSGDIGTASAADSTGNSYLVGSTQSTSNIATTGSFQVTINSVATDGFLVKLNSRGVRQWGTYYGGSAADEFSDVTYDPLGYIYVAGTTNSVGLSTTGAHQTISGGYIDAILIKFSPTGSRIWATYYGGNQQEHTNAVRCDNNGNIYLGGTTYSTTGLATTGVYQTSNTSGLSAVEGYLVKFNSAGIRQWGTFFGASYNEWTNSVAVDNLGGVYLLGHTNSDAGIATTSAHKTTNTLGSYDLFFAKFNTSNGTLLFASYFGGTGDETGVQIACDALGNFYICGRATSTNGISTFGAHQVLHGGGTYDGYIAKFNSTGVQQWGSYLGGSNTDEMVGVTVTPDGKVYTSGTTASQSGIATSGAYKTAISGPYDLYFSEWSTTGTLQWSTYFGGMGVELANMGPALSNAGYVFVPGMTNSTSGIATTNAHQTTIGSSTSNDAFLACFIIDTIAKIQYPFTDTVFCTGDTFKLKYSVSYNFQSGNTFTVQLSDASGLFTSPMSIGSLAATSGDSIKCAIPFNIPAGSNYRLRIVSTAPIRISLDNEVNIRVKAGVANFTATTNSAVCENATITLAGSATTTFPVTWSWAGPNSFTSTTPNIAINNATTAKAGDYILTATADGCTLRDTLTVVVKPLPATPAATSNGPVCPGDTLKLHGISTTPGVTYNWTGPATFTTNNPDTFIANVSGSYSGNYSLTTTLNGCNSAVAATTNALVFPVTAKPLAISNSPVCKGGILNLNTNTVGSTTYTWTGPDNFTANTQAATISPMLPKNAGKYIVVATKNGCLSEPDTVDVVVNTVSSIGGYASPNDTICGGETLTLVAIVTNGGPTPQYQWYKNLQPVPGATGLLMTGNTVINGDKFFCTMYSVGVCATPILIATDTIRMTVQDVLVTPSVSFTSIPAQPLPGQAVSFTATPVNGGYTPKYQWQRNGQNVIGAIYPNWSAINLHPYDKINCLLMSSDKCARFDTVSSDTIIVNFPTSVSTISSNTNISLYPNPNNGSFNLQGSIDAAGVANIEISNAIGQVVYRDNTSISQQQINTQVNLNNAIASGVYMLKLTAGGLLYSLPLTLAK